MAVDYLKRAAKTPETDRARTVGDIRQGRDFPDERFEMGRPVEN